MWKKRYKKNREHIRKRARKYYQKHKEKFRKLGRQNYEKNRELIIRKNIKYRGKHKEQYLIYMKKYRIERKEQIRARRKKWRIEHKEISRIRGKRKRALRRSVGELSIKTIQLVYEMNIKKFGTLTCIYCLKPIQFGNDSLEHKQPVTRHGTNAFENLAIACRSCNSKKNNKTESEYRRYLIYEKNKWLTTSFFNEYIRK